MEQDDKELLDALREEYLTAPSYEVFNSNDGDNVHDGCYCDNVDDGCYCGNDGDT